MSKQLDGVVALSETEMQDVTGGNEQTGSGVAYGLGVSAGCVARWCTVAWNFYFG